MINFRYHVVSIVAVFLALAIGIVMGTTVISESVVDRLEADARDFRARNGELREESDRLEAQIAHYEQFGERLVPSLVHGRLSGRPVVLIIEDGAPGDLTERTIGALRSAGSATPVQVRLTAAWALDDPAARERLVSALGGGNPSDGPEIMSRAAASLATRLTTMAVTADDDLLRRLDRAGFVKLADVPASAFPAQDALFVYLSSGTEAAPDDQTFTLPLLTALTVRALDVPVAVAEPADAGDSLVEQVRGVADLARAIATVDHATTWPGALSLIWALRRPAAEPVEHYGVRRGASAIAPDVKPAP